MKIGYKEILDLYSQGDSFFIRHALREAFGEDIDSADFVKAVGIDLYGPIRGRLKYWMGMNALRAGGGALEYMYRGIEKIVDPEAIACIKTGRAFRLKLLTHLAERYPERKFDVQYFL